MKQPLLPGIKLPATQAKADGGDQWPSIAELMNAVAECDLPAPWPMEERSLEEKEGIWPIVVLGLGLDGKKNTFSPATAHILKTSEVLAAGNSMLARFEHCGAEKIPLHAPFKEKLDVLLKRRSTGKRVTVLANGDPLFFGIGATLAKLLPPKSLRILPGVGSLQEACARARLPWHDVLSVSLRGRNGFAELAVAALTDKPLCLLTDAENSPAVAARFLLDRGVDWHKMLIFENMCGENESFHACALAEAANLNFKPPHTVLLVPNSPPRRARLGLPDLEPVAGKNTLLSKQPMRAAVLAALSIAPQHLIWVLEAGSELTALEASALAHRGRVFVVEQDPARVVHMKEKRRCFGAANLEIVHGDMPACLDDLPEPDAVVLGDVLDTRKNAEPLLEMICSRLKKGGRLVTGCALLGSPEHTRALLDELGLRCEITCIQLFETVPPSGELRLAALDPIFLIACSKEDI